MRTIRRTRRLASTVSGSPRLGAHLMGFCGATSISRTPDRMTWCHAQSPKGAACSESWRLGRTPRTRLQTVGAPRRPQWAASCSLWLTPQRAARSALEPGVEPGDTGGQPLTEPMIWWFKTRRTPSGRSSTGRWPHAASTRRPRSCLSRCVLFGRAHGPPGAGRRPTIRHEHEDDSRPPGPLGRRAAQPLVRASPPITTRRGRAHRPSRRGRRGSALGTRGRFLLVCVLQPRSSTSRSRRPTCGLRSRAPHGGIRCSWGCWRTVACT